MVPNTNSAKIVFLTGGGPLYWIIANALVENFGPIAIIQEQAESKKLFLKRRMKRLGVITVLGQVAFSFISKFLGKRNGPKIQKIVDETGANIEQPEDCPVIPVSSVNSPECIETLQELQPRRRHGRRAPGIIKPETLESIQAPFINYHPGLTPKYRGMNGAYWTLASKDERIWQ